MGKKKMTAEEETDQPTHQRTQKERGKKGRLLPDEKEIQGGHKKDTTFLKTVLNCHVM